MSCRLTIANPVYGGAYAYGKTSAAAAYAADGIRVKTRRRTRDELLALKPGAHDGYVSWERFEAIRAMVAGNVPTGRHHGAPKHGEALLAGLIRCRRCGRKLTLRYTGARHGIPRYSCSRAWMDHGGPSCIAFGGLRVDDAIEEVLLGVVGLAPSPRRRKPRYVQLGSGIRFARPMAVTWKRRAMLPTVPSGNTMPRTRTTAPRLQSPTRTRGSSGPCFEPASRTAPLSEARLRRLRSDGEMNCTGRTGAQRA